MSGKLWCEHLKTVDVPQGGEPKRVTLILPYYLNADFLKVQIGWWSTFPAWLREHLSAIIVDDGSPVPAELPTALPFPVRLFRIHEDRRWNWLAARNIGFHHAPEGFCLVTDMDHICPQSTATALVYGKHDPQMVYAFSRIEHSGERISPHSASFLMTRRMFWKIGGYDERMVGFYGSDGYFRRRMATVAPMQVLTDRLIRHEYQGDSSTTAYERKQPEDAGLKALVQSFPKGSTPLTLSFPYTEVQTAPFSTHHGPMSLKPHVAQGGLDMGGIVVQGDY